MLHQIRTLAGLELVNLFGLNVTRNTKDKKEKKKKTALAAVMGIVILMGVFYFGGLSYLLVQMEISQIVVPYLAIMASFLILVFDFFKAGHLIFKREGYDILSSLPLSQTAVVVSRFVRLYVENLMLAAVVMLPGILVCGVCVRPAVRFFAVGAAGVLLLPLIPMSVAVFVGALIVGISSRMRNKSIAEAVLSVVLVLGILLINSPAGGLGGELNAEKITELAQALYSVIGKMYVPALWLGNAMTGDAAAEGILFGVVSAAAVTLAAAAVSFKFHAICRAVFGTSAKHNYRMGQLERQTLWKSLLKREWKRYISSGVYVTNTIIGPVMGAALSVAVFAVGIDTLTETLPVELDVVGTLPFAVAAVFGMMSISCVSISMEGANWWIVKTLPLDAKTVLDAKLLLAIAVVSPFYLVSEVFLFLAVSPGFWDAVLSLAVPALCVVFSALLGLAVNIRFPLLKWESEVSVVKQSASGMLGGLGGALPGLLGAAIALAVPRAYALPAKGGLCLLILAADLFLYGKLLRVNLQEIE